MLDFFSKLFDTSDFPARWHCGHWTSGHGWLHILSDLGVWSAYVAIPCVLAYFVLRRRDMPFRGVFLLFGAFILACGTTHLMEAIIFWWPAYRLAGLIKLFTACVSWATVIALIPVTPRALAMRTPQDLEKEAQARTQAEAALRHQLEEIKASEERFRLLVEGTKDCAIFMLDPTGNIVSWNPGAERIKQYRTEEIIGQHFSRFYPDEEVRAGKPPRELEIAAGEGKYEEEGWRIRKDGSRFWANVLITALKDENGKLRGFSKVTRDVTERKQAQENAQRLAEESAARQAAEQYAQMIERQREQLRVTLASIGDGVITTDVDGRVTLLNPVAEKLTGWNSAEAAGSPVQKVFHIINEQTRAEAENPAVAVLREGAIVGLANHTILIAKNGDERSIDDSAAPIKDDQGHVLGVILVFRDNQGQRAAEKLRAARFAVAQTLGQAIGVQDAASQILQGLCENLGWQVGGFWLLDREGEELTCLEMWHSPDVFAEGFRSACQQSRFKRGVGLPGRVWTEAKALWIADVGKDSNFPRASIAAEAGLRAAFGFPLLSKGEALGVIEFFGNKVREPDQDLLEMAMSMGTLVGQFLERKAAEEKLAEEREWFRTTLASIGDAVITTDVAGTITFLNPIAEALTGWKAQDAKQTELASVFNVVDEQTRQPITNPVAEVLKEGRIFELMNHTILIARDGSERPIGNSAAPIKNVGGETIGVVLVFRDVTEQRRAAAEDRKHREILRLVHQIGKVGHWEWNSQTDENNWSPEIEALYGLAPGTFHGGYEGWAKLVHPDDLPRAAEDVGRALK